MDISISFIDVMFVLCLIIIFIYAVKYIAAIRNVLKDRNKPYFKLNLLGNIIDIEILLLILCVSSIVYFYINKGAPKMDTYIIDILINIGCSIAATAIMSAIIYFKFLKHIPDETRKQIDHLLNERLGYETTNHCAVIQKGDEVRKTLSDEHTEIRQNIISAAKEITYLTGKIDNEKEMKKTQYDYLNNNSKSIVENIAKISA